MTVCSGVLTGLSFRCRTRAWCADSSHRTEPPAIGNDAQRTQQNPRAARGRCPFLRDQSYQGRECEVFVTVTTAFAAAADTGAACETRQRRRRSDGSFLRLTGPHARRERGPDSQSPRDGERPDTHQQDLLRGAVHKMVLMVTYRATRVA